MAVLVGNTTTLVHSTDLPLCSPDLGHLTCVPCPSTEQCAESLRNGISKYQDPATLYEELGDCPVRRMYCERLRDCLLGFYTL